MIDPDRDGYSLKISEPRQRSRLWWSLQGKVQYDHCSWRQNYGFAVLWGTVFLSQVCVDELFGIRILDRRLARVLTMPNDEGIRRCTCGQFVLLKDMVAVDAADSSELPYMDRVPDELLPECISKAASEEMEVAARLGYWRHLNHEYRQAYRQHRDAEKKPPPRRYGGRQPRSPNLVG